MYNYIYEYQFPPGLSDDPDMVFLMERYWKGLCRYCIVLTVLYCTVLYCTVLYCSALYCTVLYCALVQGAAQEDQTGPLLLLHGAAVLQPGHAARPPHSPHLPQPPHTRLRHLHQCQASSIMLVSAL